MQPVNSTNIAAIGFEPRNTTDEEGNADIGSLTVEFRNGRAYRYVDVPETIYNALLAETAKPDGSVGRVFAAQVRSVGFEFEEVTQ